MQAPVKNAKGILVIALLFCFCVAASAISAATKSNNQTKVSGYIQGLAWYTTEDNANSFRLYRARLSVSSKVNQFVSAKVQVDFAKQTNILLDAYAIFKFTDHLAIRMGQFKPPFSTDYLFSSSKLMFIDRSIFNNKLAAKRDVGFQAGLTIKSIKLIAGIFNGAGRTTTDRNKSKDFVVRGIITPVKGLELTGNFYHGKTNEKIDAVKIEKYGGSGFYRTDNISLGAEFIGQKLGSDKSQGYYILAGYKFNPGHFIFKEIEPAIRCGSFENESDLKTNRITLGLNIYQDGQKSKLQINYHIVSEDEADDYNELMAEFQVKF